MAGAAGEGNPRRNPVSALDFARFGRAGPPGEHSGRVAAPHFLRDLRREIGSGHGAAVSLAEAPGGAAVMARDLGDRLEEQRRRRLEPAKGLRQQHPEHSMLVQGIEQARRQPPVTVDPGRGRLYLGAEAARRFEHAVRTQHQNIMTLRATLPDFMSSKAWLMSLSSMRCEIISSRCSLPFR